MESLLNDIMCMSLMKPYSEETAHIIDQEARKIVDIASSKGVCCQFNELS
jgi:ATP-dependent Zn protease